MERILRNKERFIISIPEFREQAIQDDLDLKWLENVKRNMIWEITNKPTIKNKLTQFGERINESVVEDEKENFLMPAPSIRPLRNKKRNTKSTLEDGRISRSKRVTRSSKINKVTEDDEEVVSIPIETKRTRRTKASTKGSLCSEMTISSDASMVSIGADSSISAETSKSRRTTRKGKEKLPPRPSKAMRASTRASYKCRPSLSGAKNIIAQKRMTKKKSSFYEESESTAGKRMTRNKAINVSTYKSSILEVADGTGSKRVTRSRAAKVSMFAETDTLCVVPITKELKAITSNKNTQILSPTVLFTPHTAYPVKKRVEAFEEFTSTLELETNKGKKKESSISKQASSSIISPPPKIIKPQVDSPLVKSKAKRGNKKALPLYEESDEELSDEVETNQEVNNMVLVLEEENCEGNKTYQANDKCDSPMKVDVKILNDTNEDKEVENEADNEWVSDDDDKKPDSAKKTNRYFSNTPKTVKAASPKIIEAALGSYKALRNRKVQNTSIDALTLGSKSKLSNYVNAGITPIQQKKSIEFDVKEAELQKKLEKEMKAMVRKEELMKKRTEATKRKREEKMAKVKRTREAREKERTDAKAKIRKVKEDKMKPAPVVVPEVESVKSPIKVVTPKEALNITFEVPKKQKETDVDSYNMTPSWQDVPPAQPDNPNDYGIVDKSDCSSDEENDPRKKIPLWAKLKPNDGKLLTQAMLPLNFISGYWNCKPRAPTIKEFFGLQVSKKTLKRGLNYRTSSACWNTPPLRKLAT